MSALFDLDLFLHAHLAEYASNPPHLCIISKISESELPLICPTIARKSLSPQGS